RHEVATDPDGIHELPEARSRRLIESGAATSRRPLLTWAALVVVPVVAVGWRGGYGQDGRAVVAVLAGVAAAVTFGAGARPVPRSPVAWTLAALALLSALSALWTVGSTSVALRDALAILALAAVLLIAAAAVPPRLAGAALLVTGTAVALIGIGAAIARSDPLALDICGSWRPAGPFEYPPTLGL